MKIKDLELEVSFEFPFQENPKRSEDRKFRDKSFPWRFSSLHHLFLIFFWFHRAIEPVSGQSWDGVVVTEADYQTLQAFTHELIDPKGFFKSWNNSNDGVCSGSWRGIKCANGQVTVIHLPWKGLGGRITEKIAQFQALRELSLHDNVISGPIPTSLGFLPYLKGVRLFNNRLSGSIPPSLGSCSLLQTLVLGNNSLSGDIPDSFVKSTKLFRVDLSYNQLTGPIPESFAQSASLGVLQLQNNHLSGVIPSSWVGSNLHVLILDHNNFHGRIPSSLGDLSGIKEISLCHNRLSGIIPHELGNLFHLKKLDLSSNLITGILPNSLAELKKLSILDLSQNNLTGNIPSYIGELPNLDSFNVSHNNLSGSVPYKISQRFNPTSFLGNIKLCGYSSSQPCTSNSHSETPSPRKKKHQGLSIKDIIIILSGILLIILFGICCILICFVVRNTKMINRTKRSQVASRGMHSSFDDGVTKLVYFDEPMAFSADDILSANAEVMGRSTYGTLYKVTMEDGIQVAVKRLREKLSKKLVEFDEEIHLLGKIRHPNLLALRAYYIGLKGERLLVFDYMSRGNLASFLHSRVSDSPIDWLTRLKIAKGMARGLHYLHKNVGIIHGNLTSCNVLLDEHKNVKISDYGMSRLMSSAANTHVIAASGALGYRALVL